MRKLSLLFFSFLFIGSCGKKEGIPKDVLPKEKMQVILWDMINASQLLNTYILNKDSVDKVAESAKVYGRVFQVHHITREEFEKSYAYYREHPDLMRTILDSLGKKQVVTIGKPGQRNDSTQKAKPVPIPVK